MTNGVALEKGSGKDVSSAEALLSSGMLEELAYNHVCRGSNSVGESSCWHAATLKDTGVAPTRQLQAAPGSTDMRSAMQPLNHRLWKFHILLRKGRTRTVFKKMLRRRKKVSVREAVLLNVKQHTAVDSI